MDGVFIAVIIGLLLVGSGIYAIVKGKIPVVPKPTADKSKRVNSLSIHENWGMNGKMCRD